MMHSYNDTYLDDAMCNLGDMMDYAMFDLKLNGDDFFTSFMETGVATQFEMGNPKVITGMSGVELCDLVLIKEKKEIQAISPRNKEFDEPEYWCGWALCYFQWYSGLRFIDIYRRGLTIEKILSLYDGLHDEDISLFVKEAYKIINSKKKEMVTNLAKIRKARGLSQRQLSNESEVTYRMIQLYEQRQNDINKASVATVVNLARALGCDVEDILER
ncbi:helix-turn-helix domain-containing protein [Lachnospira multipara]|uniref:helix-turn-helix domain-containing protein n=1 Tax=Lachnospira multipara TaxID=28051 RepID=UPI000483E10F|nr:helix-turn-helix transcriptional regulator [Lachnospira multipara]